MDAEKCRILIETIDHGSISELARNVGYTPSGISKSISSLEDEVGFKLLNRSRGGVSPTKECELLIPLMRELISTVDRLEQTAAGIKGIEIGTLSIGSSYNIYYKWLIEKVAEFFSLHPGIKVRSYSAVSAKLKEALDDHRIDACIMSRREGDHGWIHLKWDQLVAIVPQKHPFVAAGKYPIRELENDPYIDIYPGNETDNSRMLRRNGVKPKTQFSCADAAAALPLIEAGLGVCVVNEIIADSLRGDFAVLPIYPQQLVDIGIAISSSHTTSPIIKSFIDFLQIKTGEIM